MNPSVADFIAAFDAVKARNIFVFPNNSNIVMTARQAADIYTGAHVLVVPTKDLGAGYVAIASLDTSAGDPEAIAECAEEIASGVVCGLVSPASRDTVKDGMEVHKGGYIGFRGSEVLSSGDERFSTALDLLGSLNAGEHEVQLPVEERQRDGGDRTVADACACVRYTNRAFGTLLALISLVSFVPLVALGPARARSHGDNRLELDGLQGNAAAFVVRILCLLPGVGH